MDTPELGFKEERTAQRVKEAFQEAGLPFQDQLAITGVKAILRGKRPGPTVAQGYRLEIETVPGNLPLHNDSGLAEVFREEAKQLFGEGIWASTPMGAAPRTPEI